jgi:hypothetical protein
MELKLNGKIKLISDTQTWDSGFSKREFVITTQEQYPQDIKMEFVKEKSSLLDSYKPGEDVEVAFNVRGSEYNGKYYVNLQAWKINKMGATTNAAPPMPETPNTVLEQSSGEDDDLPF